jgi:hypothetical protein
MSDQPPFQQPFDPNTAFLPYASARVGAPQKHSGVGVASFIIGIAVGVLELAMIVLATILVQQRTSSNAPSMELAGCGMLLGLVACVVGVILGIVGVTQSQNCKVFAIWGLCINGGILLSVLGLVALGLAMKH